MEWGEREGGACGYEGNGGRFGGDGYVSECDYGGDIGIFLGDEIM